MVTALDITSINLSTSTYTYFRITRPGTSSGGASHFINGSGRTDDGGANTYTIRNDDGPFRLGYNVYTTTIEGSNIIMNAGNVGIGTNSPEAKLHINGQLNGWSQIINTGNGHLIGFTNSDNYRPGISFGRNMTDLNNQKARPNIYSYHFSADDSALIFMHHRFAFYTTDRYNTANREEKNGHKK